MAKRRNKNEERDLARSRIAGLLASARREVLGPDRDLADRHASLARRVAMRYQISLAPAQRAQVCRRCDGYRAPATTRVRVRAGRLVRTCLRCGTVERRPLGAP